MKLFLAVILSLFLFNATASEAIDTNSTQEIELQAFQNINSTLTNKVSSRESWHNFHEYLVDIEEEEELHKVKMLLSTIFTLCFKFELDSSINTFDNFYCSKEIIPSLPRYVIFEVFRI